MIREELAENDMAIDWKCGFAIPRLEDMYYTEDPLETEGERVEEMLKPVKIHVRGCLHSGKPVFIIQAPDKFTKANESRLAGAIYFKRCDRLFRNAKGEQLAWGMQEQANMRPVVRHSASSVLAADDIRSRTAARKRMTRIVCSGVLGLVLMMFCLYRPAELERGV